MTAAHRVGTGPWLLRASTPDLAAHRALRGPLPTLYVSELLTVLDRSKLLGRGGAAFPFATKLRAATTGRARRRHVVVNLSEGEPASYKDLALTLHQPHLVLDGADLVAAALGCREIHVVAPGEHPDAMRALIRAVEERRLDPGSPRRRWRLHTADPRFVSGESSAVIELIQGRPNLPVTNWQPTAVAGVHGQPTVLSNGETFAQLAALVLSGPPVPGTPAEPGTRLLTIGGHSDTSRVLEVPHGTPWHQVLTGAELNSPILLGGYHGTWAPAGALTHRTVSHSDLTTAGLSIGAGVVLPLPPHTCPLHVTATVLRYLAQQSAGRCGPCLNGLPALAAAYDTFLAGGPLEPIEQIAALVKGRGACAHPDGTARLVRSALTAFPDEVRAHTNGSCEQADATLVLDPVTAR